MGLDAFTGDNDDGSTSTSEIESENGNLRALKQANKRLAFIAKRAAEIEEIHTNPHTHMKISTLRKNLSNLVDLYEGIHADISEGEQK